MWILYSFPHNQRIRVKTADCRRQAAPSVTVPSGPPRTGWSAKCSTCSASSFEGHPDLRRILLPDGWKGYPLRKDYGDPAAGQRSGCRSTWASRAANERRRSDKCRSPSWSGRRAPRTETFLDSNEMILNMGPQHPSTHGVLRVMLKLDGEKVIGTECVIGYLHRGVEKIAENRTYTHVQSLRGPHGLRGGGVQRAGLLRSG